MQLVSVVLCLVVSCCAAPRGAENEHSQHRDLRGQRVSLSGNRGGSASLLMGRPQTKRNPAALFNPPPMPKALSDHTATVYSGLVYLAGGCDSPHGNQLVDDAGIFMCSSLSDSFYAFNPNQRFGGEYTMLPDLPRPRYRHTSMGWNNQIWLVGGRDVNDALLDTVDVYNIGAGTWSSFSLPVRYQVSDHASFAADGFIYIAGGYDQSYTDKNMVYRIIAGQQSTASSLDIVEMESLLHARGDTVATQTSDYAYVAGGYTSANQLCDALGVVERYEFATGQWGSLDSLADARADFGMVQIQDIVVVLGGEQVAPGVCTNLVPDIGADFIAVTSVAILGRDDSWVDLGPQDTDHRFRSAAVAWSPTESIYIFGGQKAFDQECMCYPTVNAVEVDRSLFDDAEILWATPTPAPTASPSTPAPVDTPDVVLTTGNDLCENAAELEVVAAGLGRSFVAYGNTESSSFDNAPDCGRAANVVNDQPGVWFFVRGTEGIMTASTCSAFTDYDTKISVYKGSCGNLQCMDANDDECDRASRVRWIAERDEIYAILVHGFVSKPVGNFAISVATQEPPNDRCAQAQGPLTVGDSVDGTTLYAALNFGGSGAQGASCQGSYGNVEGVWYYTIGTGNVMTADTCSVRTGYDTKIHVFTGNCQNDGDSEKLDCVRGNDNSVECGLLTDRRSKVAWESDLGEAYYIYVHGYQAVPSKGFFILTIGEE